MFLVPDPATEIFRQVKAHFNSDDAIAALSLSRRRRSVGKAKHFRPTLEKLAEDRERRKQLKKRGFFSVAGQPYKPVGRIQLDMKELVYTQLGIRSVAAKVHKCPRVLRPHINIDAVCIEGFVGRYRRKRGEQEGTGIPESLTVN